MHGAFEQSLPDGRRRAMALPTPCDFYNVFYQLLFPARDRVQINGKEIKKWALQSSEGKRKIRL